MMRYLFFSVLLLSIQVGAQNLECTNFDGTWVGRCYEADGTPYPNQDVVYFSQENCENLTYYHWNLKIGDVLLKSEVHENTKKTYVIHSNWNKDKTKVLFSLFASEMPGGDGSVYTTYVGDHTIEIVDGELIKKDNMIIKRFTGEGWEVVKEANNHYCRLKKKE